MAADGSLTFDTKINTDGFDGGISTLTKAMDRLTKAVDGLSSNILNRFNGAGQAMAETAQSQVAIMRCDSLLINRKMRHK